MPRPTPLVARGFVGVLAAALVAVMVRLAWLSDDAYITLRTVENVLAGHGPVWNVGERVQAYTHPLWMWLLVAARWCTGEHYLSTIVTSIVLSGAAAAVLAVRAGRGAAVVLVLLLASRAFGDYSTSGLETPLSALLLVWLAWLDDRPGAGARRLLVVALVTALLGTTRLDLIVLAGPVLLAHLRGVRPGDAVGALGVGLLPLWLWSAFALFYYGSPFPITGPVAAGLLLLRLLAAARPSDAGDDRCRSGRRVRRAGGTRPHAGARRAVLPGLCRARRRRLHGRPLLRAATGGHDRAAGALAARCRPGAARAGRGRGHRAGVRRRCAAVPATDRRRTGAAGPRRRHRRRAALLLRARRSVEPTARDAGGR
jgi:hypothetical protein